MKASIISCVFFFLITWERVCQSRLSLVSVDWADSKIGFNMYHNINIGLLMSFDFVALKKI